MKDQHTKIKGYRDLSQGEIDLMNEIKEHGEKTKELLDKVRTLRISEGVSTGLSIEQVMESTNSLHQARAYLQTGQMWFVRAVALPESF